MTWWHYPLILAAVAVLGVLVEFLRGATGTRAAGRAPDRLGAGGRGTVPVVVVSDRLRRGRAMRNGEDLQIVGSRLALVVDRAEVAASAVRRDQLDDEQVQLVELRGFEDETGQPVFVGPPEEWADGFRALCAAPSRPGGLLRRLAAGTPRAAVAFGVLAVVVAAGFQLVWWTGRDEPATVTAVEVDEEGFGDCTVRWEHGGETRAATVDCYEPLPAVDETVVVRALSWPFVGEALDDEGSYEGLTTITAGAAVILLGCGLGTGLVRVLRPATRLRALRPEPGAVGVGDSGPGQASLRELAHRVAVLEGWVHEVHQAPPPPSTRQVLVPLVLTGPWWFALSLVAVSFLLEAPDVVTVTIGAVAVVLLVRNAVRATQVLREMRAAAREPVTSEWDYVVVRAIDDGWILVLLLGQTPYWSVVLHPGRHPRFEGRCGVRGALVDGGGIELVIDGETWVPEGPVWREDEDTRGLLRDELLERLGDVGTGSRGATA